MKETFEGIKRTLIVNDKGVTIIIDNQTRRFIPFRQIVSVEYREATTLASGHIIINTPGSLSSSTMKTDVDLAFDKQSVLFKKDGNYAAEKICDLIIDQI